MLLCIAVHISMPDATAISACARWHHALSVKSTKDTWRQEHLGEMLCVIHTLGTARLY